MYRLILIFVALGFAIGAKAEIIRCGHFNGCYGIPDLALDSAIQLPVLDLSYISADKDAFIQFDRLKDSTVHITLSRPCRYDLLAHSDTLLLHRIERPGQFIQFDSNLQISPLISNQQVEAHSRRNRAEHYLHSGKLRSEQLNNHTLIVAPGDTVFDVSLYIYQYSGVVRYAADYTYHITDSTLVTPVRHTMALWYSDEMKYPSAIWIETDLADAQLRKGVYLFPTSPENEIKKMQQKPRGNTPSKSTGKSTNKPSIDESTDGVQISVTGNRVSLSTSTDISNEIILTDIQGRIYYNGPVSTEPITINNLPPGEYLISTGSEIKKFIIR